MEESKLIAECLANNRKSQKMLYDKYSDQMYSICLRYCRNEHDAQDAMQKGFISVFTNLYQYKQLGSLGAWIRKIMVRASLEQIDLNKKHIEKESLEEYHQKDAFVEYRETMTYDKMMEWLNLMPAGYRNIFSMYVLDDLSHVEISKILGITESTSRTQFLKARKFLQEKLSHVLNQYI